MQTSRGHIKNTQMPTHIYTEMRDNVGENRKCAIFGMIRDSISCDSSEALESLAEPGSPEPLGSNPDMPRFLSMASHSGLLTSK